MTLTGILRRLSRLERAGRPAPAVVPMVSVRIDAGAPDAAAAREQARAEAAKTGATLLLREFDRERFARLQFVIRPRRNAA